MEILTTTPLAVLLAGAIAYLGVRRSLPVIFATFPLGAVAAVNLPALGGSSVLVNQFVTSAFLFACLVDRKLTRETLLRIHVGSVQFFALLLAAWGLAGSFLLPRLFAGEVLVYASRGETSALIPLYPSGGNITQPAYVLQGVLVLIFLAEVLRTMADAGPLVRRAVTVCTTVHFAVTVIDFVLTAAGRRDLIDLFKTANYTIFVGGEVAGLQRLAGAFSEASAFGEFSVLLFAFWYRAWIFGRGDRQAITFAAVLAVMVLMSTSSTAYLRLFGFMAFELAAAFAAVGNRKADAGTRAVLEIGLLAAIGGVVAFYFLIQLSPAFYEYVDTTVFSKLDSESGRERAKLNAYAIQNFFDSYGLGIGLGSVRTSSYYVSLAASLGVPGIVLFFATVAAAFRQSARRYPTPGPLVAGARGGVLAVTLVTLGNFSVENVFACFIALMISPVGESDNSPSGHAKGRAA